MPEMREKLNCARIKTVKQHQVIAAENAWERKRQSIRKKQSGTARVPRTCNLANAREVGAVAKEITERMVWRRGEMA